MFYGEHEHSLDGKGRVTIPSAFRDNLAGGVFLTRGPDNFLLAYELGVWHELSRKLKRQSLSGPVARILFSGSPQRLDGQGRILIPASLRRHADLDVSAPAVIIGVDDRLEIWNPDRWQKHTDLVIASDEFVQALKELGL